jgi:hypothetical protein
MKYSAGFDVPVYDMRLCFLVKILKAFCCSNSNFHSCPRQEEMQEEMKAVKQMRCGEKELTERAFVATKYGRTRVLVAWENQQKM